MRAARVIIIETKDGEDLADLRVKELAEKHLRQMNEELKRLGQGRDLPGGSL